MARGGKLDINIDYVKLVSSERAALRAVKDVNGGGHTGAMVGGMVATSLVFFPAAPFFLFMHGKDISIPKGTEITAYVNGDMKLDIAKFQPAAAGLAAQPRHQATPRPRSRPRSCNWNPIRRALTSKSTAVSSAILLPISRSPRASTPSVVKKAGFKDWERSLKVSGGSSVHLNAQLEKAANP